ncbi:MAG TPA: DNA polymerase III subunit beta [Bacillota bacterium]|nr:DNA polymerase III subunit beta [Bacillota bacterium]
MKFLCSRDSLLEAISIVQKAVSTRSTLPILDGILIEVNSDGMKLTGYDLETGIEAVVDADIVDHGSIVIPSKLFGDIIRKLPDDEVSITSDDRLMISIVSGSSNFSVKGLSAEGFPTIPTVGDDYKIILQQGILKDMIRETIFAISEDENRPVLNGSLFECDGTSINMVAIDGFRMALRKMVLGTELPKMRFVVPGKALHEAGRILGGKDAEVVISATANHILFDTGRFRIVSRLINGEYMDYRAILPKNVVTTMIISPSEMLSAIDRASLLIQTEERRNPVSLSMKDNDTLVISSNTELGNLREEVRADINGDNLAIDFNHRYMIDALRCISDEKVKIIFTGANGPAVITPFEGDEFSYLILPLRR